MLACLVFILFFHIQSRCNCHFFTLCSIVLPWSGMSFMLSFYSLFTVIFPWLWLCPLSCCVLSCCMSLVLFPVGGLHYCSLLVYVLFCCVRFSNHFRMSSTGSIFQSFINWSQSYCSAITCVVFTCLLYQVVCCPVFVTLLCMILLLCLWSPFPTNCIMGPWSTFFLLSLYSRPW